MRNEQNQEKGLSTYQGCTGSPSPLGAYLPLGEHSSEGKRDCSPFSKIGGVIESDPFFERRKDATALSFTPGETGYVPGTLVLPLSKM